MPVLAETRSHTQTPEILPDQIHAFIQIFIKQGEHMGSMTYFLPEKISQEETDQLISGILGGTPDHNVRTESSGLTFAAREDIDAMGAIRRFVDLPGELFEINQSGRWEQLANGVMEEVRQCVSGERLVGPRESVGRTIYGFGFKWNPEEGDWQGRGINGQPAYLGKLARADCVEHQAFLPDMAQTLFKMKKGVAIQVAQDGTVGDCCPVYAVGKMKQVTTMNGARNFRSHPSMLKQEMSGTTVCGSCGKTYKLSSHHECGNELL